MKVELCLYNPDWLTIYEEESLKIVKALGDLCVGIHHIGSTSIPGLAAKNIVDIIPVVKDLNAVDSCNEEMKKIGYIGRGEGGIPFRRFFRKDNNVSERMCNVHIFEEGNPEIERHISFRNYMLTHENGRKEYENLKRSLAQKYPDDMHKYATGKNDFMENIEIIIGFDKFRFVHPYSNLQIKGFNTIVEKILTKIGIVYKCNESIEKSENRRDFVYIKGVEVVGVASIEFVDEDHAILRLVAIDKPFQNKGYGIQLMALIERWICHQNKNMVYLHAWKETASFFRRCGYMDMPFNDPCHNKIMTTHMFLDVGKVLKQCSNYSNLKHV